MARTLVNLTNSANVTIGEPGPTYLDQIEEVVAGWNAEAAAQYELENGEEMPAEEYATVVVSGDEVLYYNSDTPGDFEVIGTVAE